MQHFLLAHFSITIIYLDHVEEEQSFKCRPEIYLFFKNKGSTHGLRVFIWDFRIIFPFICFFNKNSSSPCSVPCLKLTRTITEKIERAETFACPRAIQSSGFFSLLKSTLLPSVVVVL